MDRREQYIINLYTNTSQGGSFTNPQKLWKSLNPQQKKKVGNIANIRKALSKNESYTTTRKLVKTFRRPKVVVPHQNYMWDADCAYMQEYKDENIPFIGFLVAIDIHSKFLRTCLLRKINNAEILMCFKNIFKETTPLYLRTDLGSEFIGKPVKHFLKTHNIEHITTRNITKANFAERVILTIKRKLARYLLEYNTHIWHPILQQVTISYNNSIHSTTKFKPVDVNNTHKKTIWDATYITPYLKGQH